jgi:CRP/FNR family cyclic AMP-dependent transcriptional regulator
MLDLESKYLLFRHASPTEHYEDATELFDIGDCGEEMYIVKSGAVRLMIGDTVVETVGPDGAFGEMALVDGSPRSARAVCVGPTELVPIGLKRFRFLVQASPDFSLTIMKMMAERVRARTSHLERAG